MVRGPGFPRLQQKPPIGNKRDQPLPPTYGKKKHVDIGRKSADFPPVSRKDIDDEESTGVELSGRVRREDVDVVYINRN